MKIKRLTALALSACLCVTALPAASSAVYAESQTTQLQIVRAMGILTGDQNGNLSLGSSVTRAQFVKMMCAASMLMYGKEASNRTQEIDRQHYTIPNQRPKDKHCGKI